MQTFWYRRLLLRDSSVLLAEEGGNVTAGAESKGARGKPKREESEAPAGPSPEAGPSSGPVARVGGNSESYRKLMNLLMQLRKVWTLRISSVAPNCCADQYTYLCLPHV